MMKSGTRILLFVIIIAGIVVAAAMTDLRQFLGDLLQWISSLGVLGWAIFILIYILAAILFIPATILTLGAGFLYGVVLGTVLVSIASTAGAVGAFLVGRYLARDWIRERIGKSERVKELDLAVQEEGWKIVFLSRMSPIFPYNALNYAYSLTSVRLKHFFWATWLGMLPWTIVYVYVGTLASDVLTLGTRGRTPIEWAVLMIGLIVTGLLVWYVAHLAKKALTKKIDSQDL